MKKVLFGGTFDLLHYGHILAVKKAKSFGDYLIVDVMSDERAKFKKSKCRPIIPLEERIGIVRELKDADEVVCVKGNPSICSTLILLTTLHPDVLVIDLNNHPDSEAIKQKCEKLKIKCIQMDRIIPNSKLDTTNIIKKIKKIC